MNGHPIPCSVEPDTRRHLDGLSERAEFYAQSKAVLYSELLDALTGNSETLVSTPKGYQREELACDVVADEIACTTGRPMLLEVLRILAATPDGLALLKRICEDHAEFHAPALAAELREAAADADEGPEWEPDMEFDREVY